MLQRATVVTIRLAGVLAATVCLAGCATLMERAVPPAEAVGIATIPGLAHVRYWGDEVPADIAVAMRQRMPSLGKPHVSRDAATGTNVVNYLALSGGGSDGAFGAGLLTGWSKSGTRPQFDVVTGISAGALIAPFAFLGSAYDRQLEEIWTHYGDDELIVKQPLAALFGGPSAVDTQPLADIIARYVDHKLLAAVAREYRNGRILLIGTTNIDAKRPVVWNMGEIALSRDPQALRLFRDVLLASAAIPGLMTPVKIKVDAGGESFEELHVDGGVTRQVFLTPVAMKLTDFDRFYDTPPLRRIYVIRNGRLKPQYRPVEGSAAILAATSISALLDNQASGDMYRIFAVAERAGAEFRLAADQSGIQQTGSALFDRTYMTKLFASARNQAARGYPWLKTVPEAHPPDSR